MGGSASVATVVIPVWDEYVQYLQEAVQSVRSDAPEVPIVLVDNASTTPLPKLDGVSLVRSERRLSAGAARNLGLAAVKTPYVLLLDADDRLLPGTLDFLVGRLEAEPSLAVSASAILEGETGKRHRFPRRFVHGLTRWRRAFAVLDCVWSLYPIQGCALMRTEEVRAAGGYADSDWGEDWALAVSLAFRGRVEVNQRLGRYYRPTPESLWRRHPPKARDFVESAGRIRARVRQDSGVPGWARALLPLIALLQFSAIFLVRPVYLLGRMLRARLGPATGSTVNIDPATVAGFGAEWRAFDQSRLPESDLRRQFEQYFRIFPWQELPADAIGFDLGCGSGRWARCVAPRVGRLHCIDASAAAIAVARSNLREHPNCDFHVASVGDLPLAPESMDFGYSLGVLHHVPDTEGGIRACVEPLRPGAPFLIYLYYAFDQRPAWFRATWRVADSLRRVISRLPHAAKLAVTSVIALLVYYPLARLARLGERLGADVDGIPLSVYRDRSLYMMRTDAYDRFGTRLEKRFRAEEIRGMLERAGLQRVSFSDDYPYWCAVGFKETPHRC